MLAATAVGIAAIRWDWPRAPLLLALVLGDIAERYLFLSYSLYEWSWLTRPLVSRSRSITLGGLAWPSSAAAATAFARSHPAASRADLADHDRIPALVGHRRPPRGTRLAVPHRPSSRWRPADRSLACRSCNWCGRSSASRADPPSSVAGSAAAPAARRGGWRHRRCPDVFATAARAEWLSALGWMAAFFVMLWLLGALVTVPLFAVVYLLAVLAGVARAGGRLRAGVLGFRLRPVRPPAAHCRCHDEACPITVTRQRRQRATKRSSRGRCWCTSCASTSG